MKCLANYSEIIFISASENSTWHFSADIKVHFD